jgi:phenylpyruvate tautomerase PptA (4-oxalocrotonate tautomerase family)
MPLVRISLLKGRSPAELRAIADGVHQALVETYNVPSDDRFQVIDQHDKGEMIFAPEYLGIRHTDDLVFVNVVASKTRDTPTKQALYKAIAARLEKDPGLRTEDVMVIITPNERDDWSFGNGVAQYVKDPG